MVSPGDVIVSIQERVKAVEVVALRGDAPLVVESDATVRAVIERLREARIGCALVADADRLVGIFTERDVLMKVVGEKGVLDRPVTEVMTCDPATVGEEGSIRTVVKAMEKGGFRHIPVVDQQGQVVALVRHRDMIAYLVENVADRTLNVPPDPDQVAKTPEGA